MGGKRVLDRGGGLAYQREGVICLGGFNIGFTAYFTIIEVKKIIRRFFISRFHCIRAHPYIVF